jgi:hypothetical protein
MADFVDFGGKYRDRQEKGVPKISLPNLSAKCQLGSRFGSWHPTPKTLP